MKFKDFRETEAFKAAEVIQYFNTSDNLEILDNNLGFRKIKNRNVSRFIWIPTPGFKTLRLWLD